MRMLPAHSPEFFALLAQLAVEQHADFGVLDEGDLVGLLVEARPEVDRLVDWPPTRGRSEGTSGSCAGGGEDAHEQPAADRVARRQSRQNCKGPRQFLRASGPARFAALRGCPAGGGGRFIGGTRLRRRAAGKVILGRPSTPTEDPARVCRPLELRPASRKAPPSLPWVRAIRLANSGARLGGGGLELAQALAERSQRVRTSFAPGRFPTPPRPTLSHLSLSKPVRSVTPLPLHSLRRPVSLRALCSAPSS